MSLPGESFDLCPRGSCHRGVVIHFQHPKDRQDAKTCLRVLSLRQRKIRRQFRKLGRNTNRGFALGRNFADVRVQSLRWLMLPNESEFGLSVDGFCSDPVVDPRLLVGLFQQRL